MRIVFHGFRINRSRQIRWPQSSTTAMDPPTSSSSAFRMAKFTSVFAASSDSVFCDQYGPSYSVYILVNHLHQSVEIFVLHHFEDLLLIERFGQVVCSEGYFGMTVEKLDDIENTRRSIGGEIFVVVALLGPEH